MENSRGSDCGAGSGIICGDCKVGPEERVQQRTVVQVGNVPVPHFQKQIAEVVTVILQERISWCVSSENHHKRGLVQVFRKIGREVLLPLVPRAPSKLTLGTSMPCGAPRVPEQGSMELVSVEL